MKSILLNVWLVLFLLTSSFGQAVLRYEAETGETSGSQIYNDTAASSGKFVKIPSDKSVSFSVTASKEGWYSFSYRYRSPEGESVSFFEKTEGERAIGFGLSKGWRIMKTAAFLHKGLNKLGYRADWGNTELDYFETAETDITPEITPRKNIFYKTAPADIWLTVKRYGSKIENITCDKNLIPFTASDYPDFEDAVCVKINAENISGLKTGGNRLDINFTGGKTVPFLLTVMESLEAGKLTIIAPYIEHGASVLFILPTGKTLLVDCGKNWVRDQILIPFFEKNNITHIDYFMITHYHDDHDGDDKGETIKKKYKPEKIFDYNNCVTGSVMKTDSVSIKILNSFADGSDENTRSISFRLEYNGFTYVHGGDTYAANQEKIMERFPEDIKADVFYANHHFHGSTSLDYLKRMEPALVLLQSEKAIYARSTYAELFKQEAVPYFIKNGKKFMEAIPALEAGAAVIRVNDKGEWTYETYKEQDKVVVPFLFKK